MKRNAAAILLFLLAACTGQERLDAQTRTSASTDLRVNAEDLLTKPVGENWPSYNGDYTGRRFSSLSEINSSNVAQLRAAWVFHPGNSQRLEATPVVVRGVMYVTSANDVFALDARTGRALWHYSRPISSGLLDDAAGHINRGVAVRDNFVYSETDDAHLLCLDARSGNLLWDVQYADKVKHYGVDQRAHWSSRMRWLSARPAAIRECADFSPPTMPRPESSDGVYGPSLRRENLVPTVGRETCTCTAAPPPGCPAPMIQNSIPCTGQRVMPHPTSMGDYGPATIFTPACVLAIDANTGKLKWYFQFTPHDVYDYDANETPVLVDVEENGATRHLLVQANRNGFYYVLDRSNGKFLRATPFVEKLTWANGIDPSGRPVLSDRVPTKEGTTICPGIVGATNWFSPSYNPDTGLFYVMALENCDLYFSKTQAVHPRRDFLQYGTKFSPDGHSQKILLALSAADGKESLAISAGGSRELLGRNVNHRRRARLLLR